MLKIKIKRVSGIEELIFQPEKNRQIPSEEIQRNNSRVIFSFVTLENF